MKLTCSKDKLKYFISLAEKVTSKNATLPILDSILLIAENKTLKIRATNLEVGVEFDIPVSGIKEKGKIAVPGTIINNILQSIPNEKTVTLEIINNNLRIYTQNTTALIKVKPADDFPTIPKVKNDNSFILNAKSFVDGVRAVGYGAALSDVKPEISSVYIHKDESNKIIFVSTDSFRLPEKKITLKEKNIHGFNLIIPIKNINEIVRIFDDVDEDIEICFNKNQVSFYCGNIYITSRLIDGVFPDYKQIIPKKIVSEAVVLKQDFLDMLKLTNIFTDKFNKINIILDTKKNILQCVSKNELGENKTSIGAALSGESVDMNFNLKYLIDCLQSIDSDSIALQFSGENKPLIIKGVGDNSFIYLVMPISK